MVCRAQNTVAGAPESDCLCLTLKVPGFLESSAVQGPIEVDVTQALQSKRPCLE